jgi:hypothetical protein
MPFPPPFLAVLIGERAMVVHPPRRIKMALGVISTEVAFWLASFKFGYSSAGQSSLAERGFEAARVGDPD